MAYADSDGNVYDFPGFLPVFRTGMRYIEVDENDLIPLPEGSYLFALPDRYPLFFDDKNDDFKHMTVDAEGNDIFAVASFLASGYLRTYLPAYVADEQAQALTLWAYAGVAVIDGEFYVPAMRIDNDPRSDFAIHQNHAELKTKIKEVKALMPNNRLVNQLAFCGTEYNCLCARNFFLSRYEAPVPTSPTCNSRCVGCLSHQSQDAAFTASQNRLDFSPTPQEIADVILYHFERVDEAVASFGQGCEGEPLLRAADLAKAIELVRKKTDRGTININTNGSLPQGLKQMIDSGLDSVRISLNSPTEEYYTRYYRPVNYHYTDVLRSFEAALEAGIWTSINLFFLPGFTDMETEVEALTSFIDRFPVHMLQTRNLNIDPDYYLQSIEFQESEPMGIPEMLDLLREKYPGMKLGYYNPAIRK